MLIHSIRYPVLWIYASSLILIQSADAQSEWKAVSLPNTPEHTVDSQSGAALTFVSRDASNDLNLYFHQRSWLPDDSVLFLLSNRTGRTEVLGYVDSTGELMRLLKETDEPFHHMTAGRFDRELYFVRSNQVFVWCFDIQLGNPKDEKDTVITITERKICVLPQDARNCLGINESSEGRGLVVAFGSSGPHQCRILWIDKVTGSNKEIAAVDYPISHIQSSWTTPGLVSYARGYEGDPSDRPKTIAHNTIRARIWLADLSDREPWPIYPQEEGELVTHECWWTEDRMTFCSGQCFEESAEQAHVKVFDVKTGIATIIGAGSWWRDFTPEAAARVNWWHAAGSPNGRYVAADNWHGDIALFSAHTARTRILTHDHRIYGSGPHPHVGWNASGTKVVFTSNRYGDPNVCVCEVPQDWRGDW